MGEVRRRQAALVQLQRLEASVAARAGLGMLYCTPGLQLQPTYTRFLERLAAAAAEEGPIGCANPCFSCRPSCFVVYLSFHILTMSMQMWSALIKLG